MKLKLLISTILLSATALSAAEVHETPDQFLYIAHFKEGIESGYTLIQGDKTLATVFTSKVVRTETDYVVYKTDNPLSHAFKPNSDTVLRQWIDGVGFLLETLDAGLVYAEYLQDQRSAGSVQKMHATDPEFLNRLFGFALGIYQKLTIGSYGFLPEGLLNSLYLNIMSAIDEIQQDSTPLSRHLIDSMYVPVRDWIKVNLPVSQMYDYVVPEVTTISGGQKKIDYFFEAKLYLEGYLYQTDQYKKIIDFINKNPAELENFKLELASFINSTRIELHGSEINSDPAMLYIRFLEGVKQREVAFIQRWISKVREEEAKLSTRKAQLAARALAEKARKELDPKTLEEEMLRAMGLDDKPKSAKAAQPKNPKPKPKKAPEETSQPNGSKDPVSLIKETATVAQAAAAAAPETHGISEEERLTSLAEAQQYNARRNAEQQERLKMLAERKAANAENDNIVRAALLKRQENWLDRAFNTKLASFDPSKQLHLEELYANPDFEKVCEKLRSIGCYIDDNIHGNEKGIIRWVGKDGKNVMVWFDRPHGAQNEKGVSVGWFKAIVKRLRETGMLAS